MTWPLPPEIPWPQFLRLLRHPAPPRGWLEAAADIQDVARKPLLLRWIAQHRKAPAHLRSRLLSRLPAKALAAIADDPAAHPQARSLAGEKLLSLWTGLALGEKKSLARLAPKMLWPFVWNTKNASILSAFLEHPKLGIENVISLIAETGHKGALSHAHVDALSASKWREYVPVAFQVMLAMDAGFNGPNCELVLGQAAPWIKNLPPEDRLVLASRLTFPALRRMTRAWAGPFL